MEKIQRKRILWRVPLAVAILIALFWGIWYLVAGQVPTTSQIKWDKDMVIQLPFTVSHFWTIFFIPVWVAILILLFTNNKIEEGNGLAEGLGVGLAVGLASGLIAGLAGGLSVGLCTSLSCGLMAGLIFSSSIGRLTGMGTVPGTAVSVSLAVGLASGLGAGLGAGLDIGLAAGLGIGLGVGLGFIFFFSKKLLTWTKVILWLAGK